MYRRGSLHHTFTASRYRLLRTYVLFRFMMVIVVPVGVFHVRQFHIAANVRIPVAKRWPSRNNESRVPPPLDEEVANRTGYALARLFILLD